MSRSLEPMAVAAVILTFDPAPGLLESSVRAVLETAPDVHPIVVDNGERAASVLGAANLIERVTLIVSERNGGYAAGMNQGIEAALAHGADHVVLLNDDVVVTPGWLEPLLDEFDADENVGAVQPVLVWSGASTPNRWGTINSGGVTLDRFGAGSDVLRDRPLTELGQTPGQIEAFTGGAVVLSREFLDAVGRFDERFFLYYEDVELARRGRRRGWTFRVVPSSVVEHVGSATTVALGNEVRRLQERNRLWSSAMHGSPTEIVAGITLSLRRLRHHPRAVHRRALLSGLSGMPRRLAHRARSVIRHVRATPVRAAALRVAGTPGVNVVGYHHIDSGLGSNARELSAALRAAGVPVIEIDNDLSSSPRRRPARPVPTQLHDTTIAIVTAFEFAHFCERFAQLVGPDKRMIGYWVWELADVPPQHAAALAHVDELWTPTTFVQHAYRRVAPQDLPVRLAPFRMEEPLVDEVEVRTWRTRWGSDEMVCLVSFDYLSIVERKNPLGAIAAFRAAFDGSTLPVRLVVKSINGDQRPDDLAEVRAACAGDERIEVLDQHLDAARHYSLLAAADVLVSLHRSEGYGLHPAIAMWLGTAVVATRYSGVVDFMDDDVAAMVDAELIHVINGQGIYPDSAQWADPDIEQAAAHLRRLASDPPYRERLVAAARRRIADQPSAAQFGEGYAAMLRTPTTTATGDGDEPFFHGLDASRRRRFRVPSSLRRSRAWPDTARRVNQPQ